MCPFIETDSFLMKAKKKMPIKQLKRRRENKTRLNQKKRRMLKDREQKKMKFSCHLCYCIEVSVQCECIIQVFRLTPNALHVSKARYRMLESHFNPIFDCNHKFFIWLDPRLYPNANSLSVPNSKNIFHLSYFQLKCTFKCAAAVLSTYTKQMVKYR